MRKFIVTIEGNSYEVGVEEITNGGSQEVKATAPVVKEIKKTEAVAAPQKSAPVSGEKMESPMPGLILELKVAEGATVKKGQVVLVLEAMKMANDITAPCDGVISFKTTKGANVDTGTLLAVIG